MRSAEIIREARLRAGLTQYELAERSGRKRGVIARWEQGTVAPSVETLIELVRACGFDLPLELVAYAPENVGRLAKNARLTPERRVSRHQKAEEARGDAEVTDERFDPYAALEALESRDVAYVLIGAFARVVQGTEELTRGLDLAPSLRRDNLDRLALALNDLKAIRVDGKPIDPDLTFDRDELVVELGSRAGQIKIVPEPSGTRGGYDDLRRAASREPLGRGLRPLVASIGDLARMAAALGREQDMTPLRQLRILADLDRGRARGIER